MQNYDEKLKVADKWAKQMFGIKESTDMQSEEEDYFNPKMPQYRAYISGFLRATELMEKEIKELEGRIKQAESSIDR